MVSVLNIEEAIELEKRVYFQTFNRSPVLFVKGKGMSLFDENGREYLDFTSGIGVCNIGHCHPKLAEAVAAQAARLIHTTNLFYTEPQLKLAKMLTEISFAEKVFFCNSGAEANEGAIKLALKRHNEIKGGRGKIVFTENSFHGRTLATLMATGKESSWKPYRPLLDNFVHIAFNDKDAAEKAIDEDTAAVMIELIQGEGGVHLAKADFLNTLNNKCKESNAILIFDEVQTGMGRTGNMFGYEAFGIIPDVMTLAKALSGGLPAGALLATEEAAAFFGKGDHGSTFGGNPLACDAGCAVLSVIEEEGLVERAKERGNFFMERLEKLQDELDSIVEIRGMGLMLAVEYAEDIAKEVLGECLERGYVINATDPKTNRFLPPLTVTEEQIEQLIRVLKESIVKCKNMHNPDERKKD